MKKTFDAKRSAWTSCDPIEMTIKLGDCEFVQLLLARLRCGQIHAFNVKDRIPRIEFHLYSLLNQKILKWFENWILG